VTKTADDPRPRFARMYRKASARADRRGASGHRTRLLEGLQGRVVEVGAGHGLNFAHYPRTVTEVIAIEPEPHLRADAEAAAGAAPVPVAVHHGMADALPVEDGGVDAAVASLVLCSVPDQAGALVELHRVLRPGGELRFYEHWSRAPSRCAPCSKSRIAAASGLRSPAVAIRPETPAARSKLPASRLSGANASALARARSSRTSRTSSG
jgi:ubiquinone/menaquinone biosynthesis C-methylase UbiE